MKRILFLFALAAAFAGIYAALLFLPKNNGEPYRLTVEKGQGISAAARKLAAEDKIFSRYVLVSAAYAVHRRAFLTRQMPF